MRVLGVPGALGGSSLLASLRVAVGSCGAPLPRRQRDGHRPAVSSGYFNADHDLKGIRVLRVEVEVQHPRPNHHIGRTLNRIPRGGEGLLVYYKVGEVSHEQVGQG